MAGHLKLKSVAQPQEDPDFLLCLDYLKYVEYERYTQAQFATKHSTTAVTVFRWKTAWTQRGLLMACREFMAIDMNEDLTVAERRLVRRWEEASAELINLALSAKREDVRLGAIQELWREHIKPFQEQQPDPGNQERDYLVFIDAAPQSLDPMSILRDDLEKYERLDAPAQAVVEVAEQQSDDRLDEPAPEPAAELA